jgi:lysophospholipase
VRLATAALVRLGRATDYAPGRGGYGPRHRAFAGNRVTSDPVRFARMHDAIDACPDLALGGPTIGWLAATFASCERLERAVRAGAITTPLLVALGGAEALVDNAAARHLVARLPRGEVVTLAGSRHEVLFERDPIRAAFWEHFDRFVGGLPSR